jgi:sporulation related protein
MSMAEDTRKRPEFSSDYSSPAREPANDPLAELARLIGQSDPFSDIKPRGTARNPLDTMRAGERPAPDERRSAPEWLARPAPAADQHDDHYAEDPHDDYGADAHETQDSYETKDDHGYAPQDRHDTDHYDNTARAQPAYNGGRARVGEAYDVGGGNQYRVSLPPAEDYDEDSYYAEDGHMPPHEDGAVASRKRGGLITIAAVLGLAVIGTAGAFGYRAYTSDAISTGSPPVIKADPTPAKTVPPQAVAANVDAQGKPFQDRIAALSAPERVVPREEQPMALPVATPAMTAPRQSGQAAAPLTTAAPPANANEPKRVRTMTIRPDGAETTASTQTDALPSATRSIAPAGKQAAPPPAATAPIAITPQSDPSARSKVAARTPPGVAAGGAYVVQVSAQKTEAEALSSYQAMQAKYPGVLASRSANIRRADLGDKGVYYRAQIGPFATSEQANTFCSSLKDAGGQCIVQKN